MLLGKYKGNDIELCHTTNTRVSEQTALLLLDEQIPFTKNQKKIPFFKRDQFNGASSMWFISVNPSRYSQARRAIDRLDNVIKKRIVVSNY